jgi:esterase/lipase
MFQKIKAFWKNKFVRAFGVVVGFLLMVALLGVGFLASIPVKQLDHNFISTVQGDYTKSKAKFLEVSKRDGADVNPVCKTKSFDHGKKVKKVVVMFHGFTNCPAQYDMLGKQMFDSGYNVYVPRIPHHGLSDRLTNDLENLTAEELVQTIKESIDIASGLGEEISLFGISGGSVMAAWGGYYSSLVKEVFIIAPLFAPTDYKFWELKFVYNLLGILPSQFKWWDEETKENVPGPTYAYPRFSVNAVRSFLNLSLDLYSGIEQKTMPQDGKKMVLLTIEGDPAINNTVAKNMIEKWSANPDTELLKYQFPKKLGLGHDIIDPNQKTARTDIVYPKILEMMK